MKPRLESAPLTEEDRDIWVYRVAVNFTWILGQPYALKWAQHADRRDADLMLHTELFRQMPRSSQLSHWATVHILLTVDWDWPDGWWHNIIQCA